MIFRNLIPRVSTPILRHTALPGFARFCPDLPGLALHFGGIQGIPPSRAHIPIRHQAARPPAGVSKGSSPSRFSQHCVQIACNHRGFTIFQGGTKTAIFDFHNPSTSKPCFSSKKLLLPAAQPFGGALGSLLSGVS